VGLRLTRSDFDRLRDAALSCGLAPATLARALVTQGVNAILSEAER
jgi:hypothetical protein